MNYTPIHNNNNSSMEESCILTILITTYNRATVLDALLAILNDYQQKGLLFDIIVSDDNSTDETKNIANKWKNKLKGYRYINTHNNKGMDNNFRHAYEACQTEYCWLLGDTRYVNFEDLKQIIDILKCGKYDALILNCHENVKISTKEYTDINELMQELGWQITNNASCVIPKRFINQQLYNRYQGTTFLHLGIFVENLCLSEYFHVLFIDNIHVRELEIESFRKIGWTCHPFLNFGKLWYEFILSLPNQLTIETKEKVLLDHNKNTGLFSPMKIPGMKVAYGQEFINNYKACRKYVPHISSTPLWIYELLIVYIPTSFLKFLLKNYKKIRDGKNS